MSAVLCDVSDKKIEATTVFDFATDATHGAQNFFFGSVRGRNAGRDVIAVGYDAAIPLATQTLQEIAAETISKWGASLKICILHRVGKLLVGEISVGIGVSSPHRDEAYLASRYIIEQIKIRAPIWKKEFYADGETEWLKGHALCQHAHHGERRLEHARS